MRGIVAVRTLVGLLTAWALLTIVPDLLRPFAPLSTLGLRSDFGGKIVEADGAAAKAGIRAGSPNAPGDRIDFAHTPPETLFVLFSGLGGLPYVTPGRTVEVGLLDPAGAARTVEVESEERDPPLLERVGLFLDEILGIGFVALGAFLAWHFPLRGDVFGFFLYSIWFNPGENYVFYSLLPRWAWRPQETLSPIAQAAGIAGFLLFALRFPTDRSEGWRQRVERCLPLVVVALSALSIVGSGAEFGRPNEPVWHLSFWAQLVVYVVIVVAFLSKRQLLAPVERQRVRLIVFGSIPGLFFYLLAESVESTALWDPLFDAWHWTPPGSLIDAAYLVNVLVPLSIGYAVMRSRVLPVDFIVNRGVTLGIVWAIVAMSLEATVLMTHKFLEENHVLSTLVIAAILTVAAPILEKLKEFVNEAVDRFFFVRLHQARRNLDSVARGLASATTIDEIETAIVEAPCRQFDLAAAALFVLDDDGAYRLTAQRGWPDDALRLVLPSDPLVRLLPHTAAEAAPLRGLRPRDDIPAGSARPDVALTLAPNAFIEALVLYSGHRDGSALTPDEIQVLISFVRECGALRAHVAAIALRHELAGYRRAAGAQLLADGR